MTGEVIDLAERRRLAALDELHAQLRTAGGKKSYGIVLGIVRALFGERLAYNEMCEAEELDGRRFADADYGAIAEEIETKYKLDPGFERVRMAVTQVTSEHRYHPVERYFSGLHAWDGVRRWALIPGELFGHDIKPEDALGETPPLPCVIMEKWAVSAVARVLDPGCQVDTVLILQSSEQGRKKTTFFRVLAGAWHGEGAMDIHNNKAPLLLSASFIWVWDELTSAMRGRDETAVKDFVTRLKDMLFKPYGRHAIEKKRRGIIAGTTNSRTILFDPTGDRRWWIVEVHRRINAAGLAEKRDQLWAEALHMYRARKQWHLTEDEETARSAAAEEWRAPEIWTEPIERWLESDTAERLLAKDGYLTGNDVAAGLGIPVERRDRAVETRIGLTMARLGWTAKRAGRARARFQAYSPPI